MNDFVDKFREEAKGLLENMQQALFMLEKNYSDHALVNEVFRILHTLKGAGGMFGFDNISHLTHNMENVYDYAREGKATLNAKVVDMTLKIADRIGYLVENGIVDMNDADHLLIGEIDALQKEHVSETDIATGVPVKKGGATFFVKMVVNDDLLMRGISLLNIFKDLTSIGKYQIVSINRGEIGPGSEWGIYLVTQAEEDEVHNVFLFILDNCHIMKIAGYDIFDDENKPEPFSGNGVPGPKSRMKSILETTLEMAGKQEIQEMDPVTGDGTKTEPVRQEKSTINVDSAKLDQLMNLVSELITSSAALGRAARDRNWDYTTVISERLDMLSLKFREVALDVRLIPIRELTIRFRRMVRDISGELGKKINFIIEGDETELDKNIINNLSEPLLHILRNAIDHGIEDAEERQKAGKDEAGTVKLAAYYSGTHVFINVHDDGAGIDPGKIKQKAIEKNLVQPNAQLDKKEIYNLIMLPGFSTAKKITGISGRGVGLDAVRKKIESMQGEIEIDSEPGLGTSFTIKLSQTISIVDCLLVRSGETCFLIPQNEIEICQLSAKNLSGDHQNGHVVYKDRVWPLININKLFKTDGGSGESRKTIIVNKNREKFAIEVDSIIGQHQAVLKPLGELVSKQDFLTGASILDDGTLAFMLDINKLKELALKRQVEENAIIGNHKQ
jgi:two-component system, chemotaxis family, sensor kinase CheA